MIVRSNIFTQVRIGRSFDRVTSISGPITFSVKSTQSTDAHPRAGATHVHIIYIYFLGREVSSLMTFYQRRVSSFSGCYMSISISQFICFGARAKTRSLVGCFSGFCFTFMRVVSDELGWTKWIDNNRGRTFDVHKPTKDPSRLLHRMFPPGNNLRTYVNTSRDIYLLNISHKLIGYIERRNQISDDIFHHCGIIDLCHRRPHIYEFFGKEDKTNHRIDMTQCVFRWLRNWSNVEFQMTERESKKGKVDIIRRICFRLK